MRFRDRMSSDSVETRTLHEYGFGGRLGNKKEDEESSSGVAFKGGHVSEAFPGLYIDPVVVMDFASLYPSVMREMNFCVTTRLSEATAIAMGVKIAAIPPMPWKAGTWLDPSGGCHEVAEEEDVAMSGGEVLDFTLVKDGMGREDGHEAMVGGVPWRRDPQTKIVFVDHDVRYGLVPILLDDGGNGPPRSIVKKVPSVLSPGHLFP